MITASDHAISPSQVSTWLLCRRRWGWDKIAGVAREADTPSTLTGKSVHKHVELYLRDGTPIQYTMPDGTPDPSAPLAAELLPHLPEPKTPGLQVEEGFKFVSPRGVLFHGFIDWRLLTAGWGAPEAAPNGRPAWPSVVKEVTVGDHKTTAGLRWAKSAQDLEADPQAIIYAYDSLIRYKLPRVKLQWTYVQTKGSIKSLPVYHELTSDYITLAFSIIEAIALDIIQAKATVVDVKTLPANPEACNAFNKPCSYTSLCNLGPEETMRAMFSEGKKMPTLLELLKERQAVMPAAAPEADRTSPQTPVSIAAAEEVVKINPPESALPYSPAEVADASVDAGADAPKARRGRPAKKGVAVPDTKEPPGAFAPNPGATNSHTISVLYIDCAPTSGGYLSGAVLSERANADIAKARSVADYRYIEYGAGPGLLARRAIELLQEGAFGSGQLSVAIDSHTPEGAALLGPLSAVAAGVVRGFR